VMNTGNTALTVSGTASAPIITTPTSTSLAAVVSQPGVPDDSTGPEFPSEHAFWAGLAIAATKAKEPLWAPVSNEL